MQQFSICSRSTTILVFFFILLHSVIVQETYASDATCQIDRMEDLDFLNLFTQQVNREHMNLPPEAPRMKGMDPTKPAFQFTGQGMHYNNSQAVETLRSISCDTKQLTIYSSIFFKTTGDVGGPLVVLTQDDASSDKSPLIGLFVEPASNQIVLMYHHRSVARMERFYHEIPRGKWFKLSITLSGSVMVLHIDCMEVARRVVPVPDYCVDSNNIIASVGATMYQTEFKMGLTGSLQNVGIWFGMNGLEKQCDQVTGTEICPTCGKYLVTLNKLYQLRMEVTRLKSRMASPNLLINDPPTLQTKPTPPSNTGTGHSCLIDNLSQDDNTFIYNRAGQLCFCDDGNAHCVDPLTIPAIPQLATAMTTTARPDRAESAPATPAPGTTCQVSPNRVTIGKDDKYYVKNGDVCEEYYCMPFINTYVPGGPNRSPCESRYSQCRQNFTESERNISICCDLCSACDFSSCPGNSSCTDQGGSTFNCVCNPGFEPSMNGACLDRNECKLGHQQGGHNCPAHSTCVNTIGSFECDCEDGFFKTANGQCEDINECVVGSHNCPLHSQCINEVPGYSCNCTKGYQMMAEKQCVPICNEECNNGGRCVEPNVCLCPPGFTGSTCDIDIDECKIRKLNNCYHTQGNCENTVGGHFCRCNVGYQFKNNTCADVNECDMGLDKCIPRAKCQNGFGRYRCMCREGDCTGRCVKDNQEMMNKESRLFGQGKCDNCTCNDGEVSCKPVTCDCSQPNVSSTCCPQCKPNMCVRGNQVVSTGTEIPDPQNPCITHNCTSTGVFEEINKQSNCPALSCDPSEQYLPEGACCKVCELPSCSARNNGTTISLSNGCRTCTCKYFNSMSKEWTCVSSTTCQMTNCPTSQIVYLKGECCPICQKTLLSPSSCSSNSS